MSEYVVTLRVESLLLGLAILCAPALAAEQNASAASPEPIRVSDGLMTPESVLYDAEADVYLVSNINGSPLAKDGNGFISRVSPEGKVTDLKWIDGEAEDVTLNAPKGMAVAGGKLYVADIDVVRVFDCKTGAPAGEVAVEGAMFLNDVTPAPTGGVYVTDSGLEAGTSGLAPTGRGGLFHITADGSVKAVLAKGKTPALNGVATLGARILLVPFDSNELLEAKAGALTTLAKLPKGGLDGLVGLPDGRWAVSSWEGKAVYAGALEGPFETLIADVTSPADIGFDSKRARLLVPIFTGNEVVIRPIGD
jgi:sugar lactone lactonase YvrE